MCYTRKVPPQGQDLWASSLAGLELRLGESGVIGAADRPSWNDAKLTLVPPGEIRQGPRFCVLVGALEVGRSKVPPR